MASRSVTKPAPSTGNPNALTPVHESRAFGLPVGIESDTLVTTTFQVAVDEVTPSTSQRFCSAPSIVLPGPSVSVFGLRYWRVSRMKTSSSRPHRKRRYSRVGSSAGGAMGQ